ncbi:MAG: 50S ribosomal protein L3 [Candidatus Hydrogenedentes bacterium]|nr:50S ribosomal protein L3 [Candidatus Hydrogenedentota bacterium]
MQTGILGTKLGMTRVFTEDGRWVDVTVLETGPCTVVQRKTQKTDGYDAVQVGFGKKKESRCAKPDLGHFKKANVEPQQTLREFRVAPEDPLKAGDQIKADLFKVGDHVDVAGTSKGRGFAGVHKRHNFGGGPGTHGSMFHRRPGSIGSSADPSKVIKGLRAPGHMGNERVTIQNLEIVKVDPEKNLLVVRGCVPGPTGGLVVVKKSVKGSN